VQAVARIPANPRLLDASDLPALVRQLAANGPAPALHGAQELLGRWQAHGHAACHVRQAEAEAATAPPAAAADSGAASGLKRKVVTLATAPHLDAGVKRPRM
jgi:hypothetical protein